MEEYTHVFKTLSDPTRLRIFRLLLDAGKELCVCELVDSLEEPQYNVSKHVTAMRAAGLLKSRKEGRWVYYSPRVADGEFLELLSLAVAAIPERHVKHDRAKLRKRLKLREGGKCLTGVRKEHLLGKVSS
ncbi:MAG: metalloregulator ArsR/SmtB family transcription factor [Candidatus Krumholzibacteria bacterium]|nr:metalloregulator ArsR/SmtB family transcription factor [Candidatus Krumholzibacteria bacterium]